MSSVVSNPADSASNLWRQGERIEITITDLNHNGEGVGRLDGRVVFVPDTAVGDRLLVRLMYVKPSYAHAKVDQILTPSPHRVRPSCIVADKCGGCQWQHIDYEAQLTAKHHQVVQDLERIGGFAQPPVDPVLAAANLLGYRNKVTYPIGRSPSGQLQTGYYQKGSHHLINLNQCPIQDDRLDPLLAELKHDLVQRQWGVYDETQHRGKLRHLGLRIGRRTGEQFITLVATTGALPGLEEQVQEWLQRYPNLVGVALNINPDRTNAIFGAKTRYVAGQPWLTELFAGLTLHIGPIPFFQVHTEQAEALLQAVLDELQLTGGETVLDAYCGIGTLSLPLARQAARVIGIEIQSDAVDQARHNADLNQIDNVEFHVGDVDQVLSQLALPLDVVVVDPPRKGCDGAVLRSLLQAQPRTIVYISCNPSTLARDLKILCQEGPYQLTRVQPADFFPQTAHVECAAFLRNMT